ncbi:tubulin-specific chaperone E [Trypanosoma theileri]|uniref:Tubulin-specific chaperone E n=1 Tax=Trypanosoma theileri TaxID=67003 RepID=A0A1X0P967_9TRYP|nr:tubulin-specific chaperone E [Trypanosoma theileri]ORC93371.1 tubulin-specific chaperone E [Trypanosoma theileri]
MATAGATSFLDALRSRYGAPDDRDSYAPDAFLIGGGRRAKSWELVGMDAARRRQGDHARLEHVVLRAMGVSVGEHSPGEMAAAALHRLREVDLSENPDLRLPEVAAIVQHLPALNVLQLSDTPELLRQEENASVEAPGGRVLPQVLASAHLTKLVLHNVGLRSIWQLRALVDLPALEELHLDRNGIQRLTLFADGEVIPPNYTSTKDENNNNNNNNNNNKEKNEQNNVHVEGFSWFPHVTTLSLAQNELSSWGPESGLNEVLTTAFPLLTRLFLTGNHMPNLHPSEDLKRDANDYAYLQPLELLCVKDNSTITDPCTLDALRELCPHLHTFRITYSSIFPQWNETLGRMYVVASLPTITTLNRGQVRPKERLDSEIFYIQRGLATLKEQEQQQQQQQQQQQTAGAKLSYPLLNVLREKHKDTILAIHRDGETASQDGITHVMLHLTIRCDGFEDVKKTVPNSITVGKLKALVRVIFSIAPSDQQLSFFTGDSGVVERGTELDNEIQSLAFYGICDGAVIRVVDTSLRR